MSGNYAQKLKDPRWQKKRLEIFQRDNFKCRLCGSARETLAVHHCEYSENPWGVTDEKLVTLCESCHGECEHLLKLVKLILPKNRAFLGLLSVAVNVALYCNPDEQAQAASALRDMFFGSVNNTEAHTVSK